SILRARCRWNNFHTKIALHATKGFKDGFVHLILDRLGFNLHTKLIIQQGIKVENITTLVRNTGKAVTFWTRIDRSITPASRSEICAVRGVVCSLTNNYRVLP